MSEDERLVFFRRIADSNLDPYRALEANMWVIVVGLAINMAARGKALDVSTLDQKLADLGVIP